MDTQPCSLTTLAGCLVSPQKSRKLPGQGHQRVLEGCLLAHPGPSRSCLPALTMCGLLPAAIDGLGHSGLPGLRAEEMTFRRGHIEILGAQVPGLPLVPGPAR